MNKLYDTALFWKTLGVPVIPVYYKTKQPKIRWMEYIDRLPDDDELARWFCARYVNGAVITGWSDLCILDFDDMAAFNDWKAWAEGSGTIAEKVLKQARMTFSMRGVHLYTFCPDAVNLKLPGIDVLAQRKYALIPPSIHPSGKQYQLGRDAVPVFVPSIRDLFPEELIGPALSMPGMDGAEPRPSLTERLVPKPYDPWASAGVGYDPRNATSPVDLIHSHFRIEDFFPDAVPSGGGGRWMIAKCPFHNDRSPSLSIDTDSQTCRCLASHNCTPLPLDVIGVYAKLHHLTNAEAITELSERIYQ